ncbi:PucR family transcriptional regulator [Nocardioides rubriscoriae]|uniref:PucR family transcriptional regulator n=1 Tax=Nocardioides rubriscoriae TaxID=642762 RepID=UPI0011DF9E98|nr:helix-turn-helix domain-containing protein [Nocardioides rubriscoriae]
MRAATLDFLVSHRRERADVISDRLVDTIQRDNPTYRGPQVSRSDLRHSCVTNVVRILELLADAVGSGVRPHQNDQDPAYDAARATGTRRAEQGVPLDDVLRSFRMGGRLIWEDLIERGEEVLDAAALRDIGTQLWEVVDATSAQVATAYHAHERSLVRADEQQRAELWEGLLAGRGREPGFARDAALRLDLPQAADLLVVVAPRLGVRAVDDRLSPHATAWVRRTEGLVGLVALRDDSAKEANAALDAAARADGVPVGVSAVVSGLASADDGYRQAVLALRAQGAQPGLAVLDERLPEALLLSSPVTASRLVARWVEPLDALPAAEQRVLVETLTAWVAHAGSATRTAAAVHCHRNTVVNRLRRVADLTGVVLTDDAPPVELDLALRARRMGLGSTSHPPG